MNNFLVSNLTDAQLVITFQESRDERCIGELYRRYHNRIYQYCRSIIRDHDAALDISQDVFVLMVEKLNGLRNAETFAAWLFRIARNESLDHCKAGRKYTVAYEQQYHDRPADPGEEEAAREKEQLLSSLEELLSDIDDDTSKLLRLKYLENFSIEQLESHYAIGESAVKMRLARARRRIQMHPRLRA